MGKINTSPRQAHLIFLLFNTLCKTPTILTLISIKVSAGSIRLLKNARYSFNATGTNHIFDIVIRHLKIYYPQVTETLFYFKPEASINQTSAYGSPNQCGIKIITERLVCSNDWIFLKIIR